LCSNRDTGIVLIFLRYRD